jgi:osmotically-inducible protein OsmY
MKTRGKAGALAAIALAAALAACSPIGVGIGAGAVVGVGAAQERGLRSAAEDTALKLAISRRLLENKLALFTKVTVTVVEGRVLLTGAVRYEENRDLAAELARQSESARQVLNEIQVTPEGTIFNYTADAAITAKLKAAIFGDPRVRDINYAVETVNAMVYLIGIARDEKEIERVLEHARNIAGVKRIVSHVLARDDPRRFNP